MYAEFAPPATPRLAPERRCTNILVYIYTNIFNILVCIYTNMLVYTNILVVVY